jgi:hypothetical protein
MPKRKRTSISINRGSRWLLKKIRKDSDYYVDAEIKEFIESGEEIIAALDDFLLCAKDDLK